MGIRQFKTYTTKSKACSTNLKQNMSVQQIKHKLFVKSASSAGFTLQCTASYAPSDRFRTC